MDVVALGELLIDFTFSGTSGQGNRMYEANPGGAPCNVLSMLQKLGHSTAFIGKVGKDSFGRLLENAVKEQGINTDGTNCMTEQSQLRLLLYIQAVAGKEIFHFTEILGQI